MSHPASHLDDVVHQRVRLGILALLSPARSCDFVYLRDTMETTDGNLSQHLHVLEQAGYVKITKRFQGRKPRTTVAISRAGRTALAEEMKALRALLDGFTDQP